ncbi:MAG: solute carrier family 26 protein [Candidatus Cloacimonetes bacterium]|nr:solute carrier family 26 protein [Candidatus Cloacimonadota bacterium]
MNIIFQKLKNYISHIPLNRWLTNYKSYNLLHDLQAGVTVGIMLIPQAMAYSVIAGLPPIYGLYACIFPLLLYPFFGSSKHVAVGIVAVDMIIISSSVSKFANPGSKEYIGLVILLTVLIGIIQLIMFASRLGFLINYLSRPVISGFTIAAGLIIISGQMGNLLGIKIAHTTHFFETVQAVLEKLGDINSTTLFLGAASILLMSAIKYWKPVIPTSIIIIVLGILIGWWFKLPQQGVKVVGKIPSGFPKPEIPGLNFSDIRHLLYSAITLALVQFMSIVTIGKTYATKHDYSIESNRELLSLGIGNIFNSFFRGMPVSASFSRSVVNEQSAAKTPISNIFSALVVIVTLLFLTPLFYYLPYPSLAAVVIVACFNLFDFRSIKYLYRTKKRDFIIAILTFVITIVIGIQEGILLGIIASLLAILYRQSNPNVAELGHLPGTRSFKDIERFSKAEPIDKILLLRVDASFSFANAEYFKNFILEKSKGKDSEYEALVLDCSAINDLDTTALIALEKVIGSLREKEIELYMTGLKGPVREVMKNAGLYKELLEKNRLFRTPYRAILEIVAKWDEENVDEQLINYYKNHEDYENKENITHEREYEPDDEI